MFCFMKSPKAGFQALNDNEEVVVRKTIYFDFVELQIPSITFWSNEAWEELQLEYYEEDITENRLIIDTYNFREDNPVGKWGTFPLEALKNAVFELPAYVGGAPIWI